MQNPPLTNAQPRAPAGPAQAKPHRWALSSWARAYRRIARRWHVDRHVRTFCQPLTVEGRENLSGLDNPALIIANHTSHFDTVIALSVLPGHIYNRTAVVAAADRMYRERIKGMFHSLRYNAFPITRGGGREALAYSEWLLRNKWSLLIFPEGGRSRTGELMPFHAGPAILAVNRHVAVLPILIEGAMDILPPGSPKSRPAPVRVRIGMPFAPGEETTIAEAKEAMEDAVRALVPAGQGTEPEASLVGRR